jgi:hypothetical protein
MPKRSEFREVPRADARRALAKADELLAVAVSALAGGQWTGAGLSAIHAGISTADAALIASAGIRSVSKDHGAVVVLLDDHAPDFTARERRHLAGLLALKNEVAYEQRLLTQSEARSLVDHARRLVGWAERVVGERLS